ncbi:hypothetical protein R3W88_026602 [Solanum pinnatisectum]|uniref:Reverse transcriptase n=1 Tax=Solanum pinnatisectum TaxID=50273 RepID=A0AAV9LF17_9SOLN|nr:hypothetical protein R3W88_026602 [Solanum pinnatisectum]
MIEKLLFGTLDQLILKNPFERLMDLNRRHHYSFILGFSHAGVDTSGKIWYFWRDEWAGCIVLDTIQQVTLKLSKHNREFLISAVYARCNALDRFELWEELESVVEGSQLPWIIRGDSSVILNEEEKLELEELHRMEVELKKFLKIEEEFWRQTAGMKWFSNGDKNTKFFHSYVKGRRKKLHISEIENDQGVKV